MTGRGKRSGMRRWLADFVLVFALFWGIAFAVSGNQMCAYAVPLPAFAKEVLAHDSGPPAPVDFRAPELGQLVRPAQTSPEHARLLLSVAFAAIAAFNLGFWRHLRRVYASPRRSVWRRG